MSEKYGILGLARSGISLYKYLINIGITSSDILCWDDNISNCDSFRQYFPSAIVEKYDVWPLEKITTIIPSPGIPKHHPIFDVAKSHHIKIISDMELFITNNPNSKIILVTGTNGKSTTSSLIAHILQNAGLDFHLGGNIGIPVLELPSNAFGYVIEISSFQLDLFPQEYRFPSNVIVSILLNITPDHLDRHGDLESYIAIKCKIFNHQGIKIIGTDSTITRKIYNDILQADGDNFIAISGEFAASISMSEKIYYDATSNELYDHYYDNQTYKLGLKPNLFGRHNLENIAAAFAATRSLDRIANNDIIRHISTFQGLSYRNEYVGKLSQGLKTLSFYNDSKATNIDAAIGSLSSLEDIYWLAGGCFKEKDFSALDVVIKKVYVAYLFGRDAEIIANYLQSCGIEHKIFSTMEEALSSLVDDFSSAPDSKRQFNALLAPICSSLDQFKNSEHRGEVFRSLCLKYIGSGTIKQEGP
jgi:UDP-N-acetylmuramoylalanine--D-glutamate ligase